MKTVIFTQRVDIIEAYNERRDCADQRITELIKFCGYLPVPIPNKLNHEEIENFIGIINPSGIIFTGGNSLVKYGGNAPERDFTEHVLVDIAIDKNIPVYALCRGMQFILDYFAQELVNVKGHVAIRHELISDEKIYSGREVNSYHNQACVKLIPGELETLAKTSDGVIEAVRHKTRPILATMWHPERESVFVSEDIDMIKNLFAEGETN
ncbi:MAG: gamma-glutamyl-gamma-aminobutyrate hydrolase family protein [Synergistaceae bacterium]|nr:gamma-glutamyl-gamma-aminobutyrate hydrolase family protein [Synergistaceae bacterium]